jgi:hypothetical protein
MKKLFLLSLLLLFANHSFAKRIPVELMKPATILPANILQQLPSGYELMSFESGFLNDDKLLDYLVVARKISEKTTFDKTRAGAPRPLILFIQNKDASFFAAKRNDGVIFQIDEGGQCDSFDGEGELTVKNQYFTVVNAQSCGDHWQDYLTFKYNAKLKDWQFHKHSVEHWRMNEKTGPNDDALVSDGIKITKSNPKKPILFQQYKR